MQPDPPPKKEGEKMKRCPFHDLNGHTLEECLAFRSKSLEERTEWLRAAGLCYRCLSKGHTGSSCKESIECSICKDRRHPALLHRERTRFPTQSGEAVDSKCTSTCNAMKGGVANCYWLKCPARRSRTQSIECTPLWMNKAIRL